MLRCSLVFHGWQEQEHTSCSVVSNLHGLRSGSSRAASLLPAQCLGFMSKLSSSCAHRSQQQAASKTLHTTRVFVSLFCLDCDLADSRGKPKRTSFPSPIGHSQQQVVSHFNIGSNHPAYIGYCPNEMRSDVGSIPLMCLLSTLTSGVLGYLPNEDLTNSIIPGGGYPPGETIIPTEIDESEGSPDEESETEGDSIYRKKVSTFRRRNINAPFGGRVPFSRMAYKAGYGSNRIGFSRNANMGSPLGGYYGERNPYGTVNLGSSFPTHGGVPEEYNMRPSAPYSGLIGGSRAGYYGSTVGMRRGAPAPMSSRKPKMPTTEYPPDYASNDLMNSFNGGGGGGNPAIPSLRELATYASRYGPAYLRERFGAHESGMERMPYAGGPQVPVRGGGMPIDFNMNIASNQWNKGVGAPIGIMSRDVDSYQHDDATKANSKKTGRSTTTTGSPSSTSKPRKARKPVKKTSTTTTTVKPKPEKAVKKEKSN